MNGPPVPTGGPPPTTSASDAERGSVDCRNLGRRVNRGAAGRASSAPRIGRSAGRGNRPPGERAGGDLLAPANARFHALGTGDEISDRFQRLDLGVVHKPVDDLGNAGIADLDGVAGAARLIWRRASVALMGRDRRTRLGRQLRLERLQNYLAGRNRAGGCSGTCCPRLRGRSVRAQVLARDRWTCQRCGAHAESLSRSVVELEAAVLPPRPVPLGP
jgi:hypothetical protein